MPAHDCIHDPETWQSCWATVCSQGDGQAHRAELIGRYSEPHRAYHTTQHLNECLNQWAAHQHLARHPQAVYLAIWYHDAIYDTTAHDNEQASADLAARHLSAGGANSTTIQRIQDLVLATRHAAAPTDPDQQLLVDMDLAILGADESRFAQYQQQIRQEYAFVPADLFAQKRSEVLRGFLSRPNIYATEHFNSILKAALGSTWPPPSDSKLWPLYLRFSAFFISVTAL